MMLILANSLTHGREGIISLWAEVIPKANENTKLIDILIANSSGLEEDNPIEIAYTDAIKVSDVSAIFWVDQYSNPIGRSGNIKCKKIQAK